MMYQKKYDELKACPWRLSGSTSIWESKCLKADCLAWSEEVGCLLIPPPLWSLVEDK